MNLDHIVCAVECAVEEAARRVQRGIVLCTVLTVLGATAFGFATAAVYLALAAEMRPLYACLVIAGACLALALLAVLIARGGGGGGKPERRPPERPRPPPDAVSHLIATFLAGVRAGREGFDRDRR